MPYDAGITTVQPNLFDLLENAARADHAYTEVGQVLIEARERLMLGWCQGRFCKRRFILFGAASYCAAGAIMSVKDTPPDIRYGAYRAIEQFIGKERIVLWNDASTRRQEDVLEVFDRAIATQMV